jgi:hypothetical protein
MTSVEHGFNPRSLGYHFGYTEPRVIRRIDELAELQDGWHFGTGAAPLSTVLAVAKAIASYALYRLFTEMDAFPGKNGEVTIAIYVGEEDHSFQVRQDLSHRYWSESDPDSEIEEGLSFEEVLQKIDLIARAQPPWNLSSSFTFGTGTLTSGTFEVRPSKTPATGAEYPRSIWTVFNVGNPGLSVNTPAGSIQRSVLSHRFFGDLTNPPSRPATR